MKFDYDASIHSYKAGQLEWENMESSGNLNGANTKKQLPTSILYRMVLKNISYILKK